MRFSLTLAAALLVIGLGWSGANADTCLPPGPAPSFQAQAEYLSSNDYYEAQGGTPRDYVIGLYADVLGRPPSEAEIQRWSSRFLSCGYPINLAREFLIYAQRELAARAPAAPTPVVLPPIIQPVYLVPTLPPVPAPARCGP
jgi:hypothetical protein